MKWLVVVLVALFCMSCTKPVPAEETETVVAGKAQQDRAKAKPGGPPVGLSCGDCGAVAPAEAVVLVHGRNDTASRWDALVADFTSRGYTEGTNLFRLDMTTYCGDNGWCSALPGYPSTSVNESYALCLQAYIDSVLPCGETCPAVDLVGHSQGTIAVRYYARFLAPAQNRAVQGMVLMSGPQQGIVNCGLAGACSGVSVEDCPDSALLRKLNGVAPEGDGSNDETPAGATYNVVVSDKENVISPWCSGYLIASPDQLQSDDMDCRRANYTVDAEAPACKVSVGHLLIPSDASAVRFAYCKLN